MVKQDPAYSPEPEDGEQFKLWSESAHAKAYETLASEEALAEGKKHGIDNPQTAPQCLECHATAFAVMDDLENQKITMEEGVSCESCHGPGSAYAKKSVKKKVAAGEIERASVGLWEVTEEVCTKCHREEGNSFYTEFDFEARVADIAHPINSSCREMIQERVIEAFAEEKRRSRLPGYVPSYDDFDQPPAAPARPAKPGDGEKASIVEPTQVEGAEKPRGPHKSPAHSTASKNPTPGGFGAGIFE